MSLFSSSGQPTPPGPTPPYSDEAVQRLRRNRAVATGLLAGMGLIYAATHLVQDPGLTVLLVRSTAEAGVVGGLADWFAVTALFRHPLGLPIPHTAIIPSNKDRIARALGRFVERNFLTREALLRKLRDVQVGRKLAEWLSTPETATLVADAVTAALPPLVHSLSHRDLHEFYQRTVGEQLRQTDLALILGRVIRLLTASGEADELFERAVDVALDWIEDNRSRIDKMVAEHSRWWIPKAVNRRVASAIVTGLIEVLEGLQEPDNEARQKFREALDGLVDELLTSPERRAQVSAAKNRVLSHPDVQAWLNTLWRDMSQAVLDDLTQPDSRTHAALVQTVTLIGGALATDPALQRYVDSAMEHLAARLIVWRGEIGGFIAEVVRNWDARSLSERLEFVVGSDLQYIRINGTIVGGLAGALIFVLTQVFT
ncbi:MAG TPA: DUF445 domain-containing protein [Steroidobacteraceae bacterium]|nr:DUF445 domain-containing protein [Steroidobacteraceae bacterium]